MAQKIKYIIPNAFTLANIILGFLAIISAARGAQGIEGAYERSVYLLFFAGVCDLLDGRLARLLNASSKFGMELDSLSDVVSFGIAPAVLIYLSVLQKFGVLGAVISAAYLSCGALRLARFNIDAGPLSSITFQGFPIPVAAGYVMSIVLVRDSLPDWLIAGSVAYFAGAMVSTLKVPKFRKGIGPALWMLFVGLCTFIAFMFKPSAITWHIWNGWNCVLLAVNYVSLYKLGYLGKDAKAPTEAAPTV